jgi:exosortase
MIPPASYRRFAVLSFAVLWIGSLLIWWRAIAATLALATTVDAYTHILLILPVSLLLIGMEWKRSRWKPDPSIGLGAAIVAASIVIAVAGLRWGRVDLFTGDIRLALEMLALLVFWIGAFLGCFGTRIFRESLFPLLFLVWMIPLPQLALDWVVNALQQGTTWFARVLFVTARVPVAQDGTSLTIPGITVQVAQECSSIRSSMMLIVTSTLMSYLLLRSFWGKTLVVLAAIPLSIAKNGLRVFVLGMLGAYVDPSIFNSPLHHQGGPVFFAIALAGIFLLIWLVGKLERRNAPPPAAGASWLSAAAR